MALGLVLAGMLGVAGCEQEAASRPHRPPSPGAAIAQVSIGRTTPAEIEHLFGVADDRALDGALVYRFDRGERHQFEMETVTFRFEHGVLSKVCRARS